MPGYGAHAISGKIILSENIKIKNKDDFFMGTFLPDLTSDKKESHLYTPCGQLLIPDDNAFAMANYPLNDVKKGKLAHLKLDKYFLKDFVPSNIKNFDSIGLFAPSNNIYEDYTSMHPWLIKDFGLSLAELNRIMEKCRSQSNEAVLIETWKD